LNYLLDKQVKLNTEISPNLYQWCIDEVTNKEAHCAKDTEACNSSIGHFNEGTKSKEALTTVFAELKKPLWWILFALVLLLLK